MLKLVRLFSGDFLNCPSLPSPPHHSQKSFRKNMIINDYCNPKKDQAVSCPRRFPLSSGSLPRWTKSALRWEPSWWKDHKVHLLHNARRTIRFHSANPYEDRRKGVYSRRHVEFSADIAIFNTHRLVDVFFIAEALANCGPPERPKWLKSRHIRKARSRGVR